MTSLVVSGATATRSPTIREMTQAAFVEPGVATAAAATLALVRGYCAVPLPRILGCDTPLRIGIRICLGMSVERAAAREYAYRWHLFLDAWINHTETRSRSRFVQGPVIYPAPHPLGP